MNLKLLANETFAGDFKVPQLIGESQGVVKFRKLKSYRPAFVYSMVKAYIVC
jgi:hypothetical protein